MESPPDPMFPLTCVRAFFTGTQKQHIYHRCMSMHICVYIPICKKIKTLLFSLVLVARAPSRFITVLCSTFAAKVRDIDISDVHYNE